MSGAAGQLLLSAPMPAVRRALKLQHADAVFGPAGKRRVRLFAAELDVAALTARISRARLLAFAEGEERTTLAVWRAGKLKLEGELPRVLRTPADLREATVLVERIANALEGEARSVIKAGTATLDLVAGIAGVGGAELHDLHHAELLRRAQIIAGLSQAERADAVPAPLRGLRHLRPTGEETPLLPLWAEEGKKLLEGVGTVPELLELLDHVEVDALTPGQRGELGRLAAGIVPFAMSPPEKLRVRARARALLGR